MKSLHKMVTPRPPFMKSLFIYFSSIFWAKNKDNFEGCLKGVLRVFEGCCRVFEVCLKGVWKNEIEVWNQSDPLPRLRNDFTKNLFFTIDGFPNSHDQKNILQEAFCAKQAGQQGHSLFSTHVSTKTAATSVIQAKCSARERNNTMLLKIGQRKDFLLKDFLAKGSC